MHMQHHQRSITLMGCLDELNRSHHHQRNLQKIYNHTCQCQSGNSPSHLNCFSNRTLSPTSNLHHTSNLCLDTHPCLSRDEKNRKLSELHKNSVNAHKNLKSRELFLQNKKIVNKLVNVKSQLGEWRGGGKDEKDGKAEYYIGNLGGYGIKAGSKVNVSSSAVNRDRQSKRIQNENRSLNKRLLTAMSKSKYSQQKIKTWKKFEPKPSQNFLTMRKTVSEMQQQNKKRLLYSQNQNRHGHTMYNNKKTIAKNLLTHYFTQGLPAHQADRERQIYDNLLENDRQNTQTQKSQIDFDSIDKCQKQGRTGEGRDNPIKKRNYRMKTQGHTYSHDRPKVYAQHSSNEITKLLEDSINYIQKGNYKKASDLKQKPTKLSQILNQQNPNQASPSQSSNKTPHMHYTSNTNTKTINRLKTDTNYHTSHLQQKLVQKQSESVMKMRRAAMLHFRKIQKLKATQSKVWQLPNQNISKNQSDLELSRLSKACNVEVSKHTNKNTNDCWQGNVESQPRRQIHGGSDMRHKHQDFNSILLTDLQ